MGILTRRKLFSFALFLGGGMAAARALSPGAALMLAVAGGLGGLALLLRLGLPRLRFAAQAAALLYFTGVFFGGAGYYAAREEARPAFDSAYDLHFEGKIAGSPYLDEGGARFVCALEDVALEGEPIPYKLRLYLRGDAKKLDQIACGQKISGTGHLYASTPPTNPHQFDFGEYLWRGGLAGYVTAKAGDVTLLGEGGGLSNLLFSARKALAARVRTAFPENPEIVMALVLGQTRDIDTDLRADFSRSGVAHVLSVSGLHVTLVAAALSFALARLIGARASTYLSLLGIIAYAAIVGFRPSVTRAVIMYAVLCGAPLAGRLSDGSTRLALAFSVVLLANPMNLTDAGFVFSFSASAGIIWLVPPMTRLLRAEKLRRRGILGRVGYYFASLAIATTAAQIATFPALALFYGRMPVYSIAANLFLVPYTLLAMYGALIGIALPPLAILPDHMLSLLKRGVSFFAGLPHGEIPVKPPHWIVWLLFLGISIAVSDMGRMKEKWKPWATLTLPILAVVSLIFAFDQGLMVVFLDVGQADAALIRVDGRTYAVDVGEDGSQLTAYINGEGWAIDGLFLSHPHADHAGGLGELAEACAVSAVYVPAGWFDFAENRSIVRESEAVVDAGIPWLELSPGEEVALSRRATMTALASGSRTGDAVNDMSMVLLLTYGDAEALFTGDAQLLTGPDVELLKVGHHGARGATGRKLLESILPEVAVISVGGNNSYGHPSDRVVELIEEVGGAIYRTDESGAVTVYLQTDGTFRVDTFIKEGSR